ncbi:MAG TPA: L-rhamnose/proton symporter RhaT [Acidobacteriaceae bacterium]|nr:L-rhamnose/proton symporter RhaT [Acidobacteriaceae bacterium]
MSTAILGGIGWHMVGAAAAASFYAPIEKVKKWSWETTWAVAGMFSWILLPIIVSLVLLPDFHAFYASIPSDVLLKTFLFGCMWGVGNVNYGLTMRYLGMSLGIGVAIGVTLVVGTLVPPIVHGQLGYLITSRSGHFTLSGIVLALIGIATVSWAGHQKEQRMGIRTEEFNLTKGLLLAVMCGIFSSGMSFAIDAARPIASAAQLAGVKPLYAALPSYVIIMGGGAIVNFAYCFSRLAFRRDLSLRSDLSQTKRTLVLNSSLAATAGIMWYLQFFFYAWGAANIPVHLSFVNWMLHMSMYVLFGGIVGLALGEWRGARGRPVQLLWSGMVIIIAAANLVGLGMAT